MALRRLPPPDGGAVRGGHRGTGRGRDQRPPLPPPPLLLLLLLVSEMRGSCGVVAGGLERAAVPADCAAVPPDPPIPSSSWSGGSGSGSWLGDSSASLQGWNQYQKTLVDGAAGPDSAQYIRRLVTERLPGLRTLVMEPPRTAFRYGGNGGAGGSNETEFAAAVKAFRGAGLKVLLYSSLVHKGDDVQWANGSLFRNHPDWAQRHRDGSPTCLGNGAPCTTPMLSPSNQAAVLFEVNYTLSLLERYPVDGVYLDDNQLGGNASDPADFSLAALASWREYLAERFGAAWSAKCLGIRDIKSAPIPPQPPIAPGGAMAMTPQWAVWLRFRNREMAKANEAFRHALHAYSGAAVVAGNELQFADFTLATDLQVYHEDALLTESYDVEEWSAAKAILARGLAASGTAPAWIGLFGMVNMTVNPQRLRADAALAVRMIAACYMTRTKPHFSGSGLQQEPPDSTQRAVAKILRWFTQVRSSLFDPPTLKPVPPVAAVLCRAGIDFRSPAKEQSSWSLEIGGDWLVKNTQAAGAPAAIISAVNLGGSQADLLGPSLKVLLLQNATVLSRRAGLAIAAWAKAGGTVIASSDTGTLDELGRPLPAGGLILPQVSGAWGKGRIIVADAAPALPAEAAAAVAAASWEVLSPRNQSDWQFMPYVDSAAKRLLLHALYLGAASGYQPAGEQLRLNTTLELLVPGVKAKSMTVHSPVDEGAYSSDQLLSVEPAGARLTLRSPAVYCVIEINY